nr:hypothetical protein [Tanacetum cinerariifolium]
MVKTGQERTRDCEEYSKAGSKDIFCALKSNHKMKLSHWPGDVSRDPRNTASQGFYTKYSAKETQARNKTDCHPGNPCDFNLHPTAKIKVQKKDPEGFGAINRAIQLRVL